MGRTGLVAWMALSVVVGAAACGSRGAPATAPVSQAAPAASVLLDLAPGAGEASAFAKASADKPPLRFLAGTQLAVTVAAGAGEQGRSGQWQFAFGQGQEVLAGGAFQLDDSRQGRFRLTLPDVRHRTACSLMVSVSRAAAKREVVVYPSAPLAVAADRLRSLRVAVMDGTGRVQAALAAEKVAFEKMETDIERTVFDGDLVILAGFMDARALRAECLDLDERIKAGMAVLILNPPSGWLAWKTRRQDLAAPISGEPHAAKDFGQIFQASDLGRGPWQSFIEVGGDAVHLVWIEPDAGGGNGTASRPTAARPLVGARLVGRGRLMVAILTEAADPATNAVGRTALDELLLWLVRAKSPNGNGQSE